MESVYQTPNQTIRQHGEAVWENIIRLVSCDLGNLKIPTWFLQNHHWIVNNLHSWKHIEMYAKLHDVGKIYCRVLDENGRQHFPNHAEKSKETFLQAFPTEILVAELIGLDMIMHTENYEQIMSRNLDLKTLLTLLISAFAEINSNAEMFAGFESVSFKAKFKKLDRLGKRVIASIPKHIDEYLYVFVRKDIPSIQAVVQSSHAVFELAKSGRDEHPSIVVLEVEKKSDFTNVMSYLMESGIQFKIFREPMEPHDSSITAIATEPLNLRRKEVLKNFKLLKI